MGSAVDPKCLASALRMLKASDKFESEIRTRLARQGFESGPIESVIEHLIRRKLIDDRRSIANLIASKSGRRAVGIEKLRAEMLARGAPEGIVEERLSEVSPDGQYQAMLAALSAKFEPHGDRVRGARFLLSRGFPEDQIEAALDAFFQMP